MSARQQSQETALCRDCRLRQSPAPNGLCRSCGSPRLLSHPELFSLSIAHIDCDAFYAAVEKRDDPDLLDKPVIIGGGRRGVVSTACYIARIRGVHSAMPMFKALKACPDAVVIKPNMDKYSAVGREVRERMREMTPLVEPLSIDEAFLDLTGTERLHKAKPAEVLAKFATDIERDVGITVSVGLSYNKFLAKVASDFEKPRGFSIIGQKEAVQFLDDKPVTMIWGVGTAMQSRLAKDGLTTIGQLRRLDETELMRRYGVMGQRLSELSRGADHRIVKPTSKAKSISAETTFNHDYSDYRKLVGILRSLSEKVSRRMKKDGKAGTTITLKLKTDSFKIITRSRQVSDPTQLADRIHRVGSDLLKNECDGRRFRLIGIGVSTLEDAFRADPDDLVDIGAGKRARAERAVDSLREKFGKKAVELGLIFEPDSEAQPDPSAMKSETGAKKPQ